MKGPSRALVEAMCRVDPVRRRLWAGRLTVASCVMWALSHVAIEVLPGQVFEHIMLAISWGALVVGAISVIATEDVKVDTNGGTD